MHESPWVFAMTTTLSLVSWIGYLTMMRQDVKHPPVRMSHHTSMADSGLKTR
jgi:hypothetical protein